MATRVSSFGIIPILVTDGEPKFLLIHMYGSAGGTHWTFPKGRPDKGETPVETALRETKEEVGVTPYKLIDNPSFSHEYTFTFKDDEIEKSVEYFIGFVKEDKVMLQPEEVKEAKWCSAHEAMERITYESNKVVFQNVLNFLERESIDKLK